MALQIAHLDAGHVRHFANIVVAAHADVSVHAFHAEFFDLAEQMERLYQAIRQLPEAERAIIVLHLDGYSNDEVADIAGLSKNNVAVKLHRIKNELSNRLKS